MAVAGNPRRPGGRLGQASGSRQGQARRARRHQTRQGRASNLGVPDRLGQRRRRCQFPRRRLRRRHGGRSHRQRRTDGRLRASAVKRALDRRRPSRQIGASKEKTSMLHAISAFSRIGEENAFAVLATAGELQRQGRDIINLGIGQPDFSTPSHIVDAAVKALRDGQHGYTPATGILPLREAVAADLKARHGVDVAPDLVMIVPGGKVTMYMAILMFGEPGVDILYPDPGFPIYRSMIEYTGARPVPVPIREENGFAFSADETLSLITPQTRLLIFNSPANPTGGVTPKAEVDKLVAGLARFPDVAVMSDEIYDQMVYDGETHVCLLSYPSIRDRLILLNGWSKTYAMTGWRLGYAVWPGKLYDYARKLAVNLHSCVNAAAQYAGLAALTGPQ